MRNCLISLCLCLFWTATQGQDTPFSLQGKSNKATDTIHRVSDKAQSLSSQSSTKSDSLHSLVNVNRFKDSLKIVGWSDSLRQKVSMKFSAPNISKMMDSLRRSGMPAKQVEQTSDSLIRRKEALLSEVNAKQGALHKRVAGRYDGWLIGARQKLNLDSSGVKIPDAPGVNGLPNLADPLRLPQSNSVVTDGLGAGIPQIPSSNQSVVPGLQTEDFSSLEISKELTAIGGAFSIPSTDQLAQMDKSIPSMPNPLGEISGKTEELKAIRKDPSVAAENAVGQLAEVSSATNELQQAEQLTKQNEALQTAEQMKDPAGMQEVAQKQALNHFQGQEALLQGAMDQMSKYKEKYPSLSSINDVKKTWLPVNGLKGVPFRERIRVGVNTGFRSTGDTILLDFFPNASYRISGRFEAGLAMMYRVRVKTKEFGFDQKNPVWGTSAFLVAKTFKSLFVRVEVDGNSYPKSTIEQPSYRDWRWSFLSGVQTNFRISPQWSGNVQMLYNFDSSLKDGFPERLALRFGVQYKLPKKKVGVIEAK